MKRIENLPDELTEPSGFIGDVVRHMNATAEYNLPELFLSAALSLISVITGRKAQDYRGTRTNLYSVNIAPSGAGKDHPRKINRKILAGTDLEGPERFTGAHGLHRALEVSPALLSQVDEIGLYLKAACDQRAPAHVSGVIDAMMTLYTSPDSVFRPTGYADITKSPVIDQPALTIYGSTTPGSFFDGMTGAEVANGFMGRIMIFMSPGGTYAPQQDFKIADIPPGITQFAQQWIERDFGPGNLSEHSPTPTVIPISDEALERVDVHITGISERRLREDETTAALWSRSSEKTSKLALLASLSRGSQTIELCDMDWAIAVSNFLTRRMIKLVQGNVASTPHERNVQRLLRTINDSGGCMSIVELGQKTRWINARDRNQIQSQLLECGDLIQVMRDTKGRPANGVAVSVKAISGSRWIHITAEMQSRAKAESKAAKNG
jgi:hypothetical protein